MNEGRASVGFTAENGIAVLLFVTLEVDRLIKGHDRLSDRLSESGQRSFRWKFQLAGERLEDCTEAQDGGWTKRLKRRLGLRPFHSVLCIPDFRQPGRQVRVVIAQICQGATELFAKDQHRET